MRPTSRGPNAVPSRRPARLPSGIAISTFAIVTAFLLMPTAWGDQLADRRTTPNIVLILADEPESFAARLLDLLADPARRTELGGAGQSFARTNYGWDALVPQLEKIYHSLRQTAAR